jgi:hypothetical protein
MRLNASTLTAPSSAKGVTTAVRTRPSTVAFYPGPWKA